MMPSRFGPAPVRLGGVRASCFPWALELANADAPLLPAGASSAGELGAALARRDELWRVSFLTTLSALALEGPAAPERAKIGARMIHDVMEASRGACAVTVGTAMGERKMEAHACGIQVPALGRGR